MKSYLLGLVMLFYGTATVTSGSSISLDDVIRSLQSGNASSMSRLLDDHIEVSLPDKTESYSKAQGLMVLKDFFAINGVKGFDVKQKGENDGQLFCIGTLHTRSGSYRTSIFMISKNGRQLLHEIRFQPI